MGKHITPKKRAFAKHYAECGDITAASKLAGYANPTSCYRMMGTGPDGVIKDEVLRALLIEHGAEGIAPVPPPIKLPAGGKKLARVVQMSEHRPSRGDEPITAPTIDQIRGAMWQIAQDENTPAGPRVQALTTLLKDSKDEFIPDALDPSEVVDKIKLRLGLGRAS